MLCGEHPFYSEDKETLYTNILYKEIEFPHYLSENAKSLLKGVLFLFFSFFSFLFFSFSFLFLFFISLLYFSSLLTCLLF